MRPCPHCSKEIKDNAELCKWCQRPVPPPGVEAPGSNPVIQAREARQAGARLFQTVLPLSETTGFALPLGPTYTTTKNREHASVLDAIEAEGWHLEHANYVYRVAGSISRDRFFATSQQEAVTGEVVGRTE